MSKPLHDAFQEVLEAVLAGEDLDQALEAHPHVAEKLRPLLEIALMAHSTGKGTTREAEARDCSRTRMLQHAARLQSAASAASTTRKPWRLSLATGLLAVAFFFSSTGIWVASAQSLPGDPLYPFKRTAEDLSMTFVSDQKARYDLNLEYRGRRVEEVKELLANERIETVTFAGTLLAQNENLWDIDQILVIVHTGTKQAGPFTLGDQIEVKGITTRSGAVLASALNLRRYYLVGPVITQDLMQWVIAGRSLDVSNAIIQSGVVVGSLVEVEVDVGDDGRHRAVLIGLVEGGEDTAPAVPTTNDDEEALSRLERFEGSIENMSASALLINGRTFILTGEAEIEGVLAPGVVVRVEAGQAADGTWIALEIKVRENEADEEEEAHEGDGASSKEEDATEAPEEEPEEDDPEKNSEESEGREDDDHRDEEEEENDEEDH